MPELPEVEHLRRSLEPHLVGRKILAATLHRSDVCESFDARGKPLRHTTDAHLLVGGIITTLLRHGKQLALVADSGTVLLIHLGMSGRVTLAPHNSPRPKHTHAEWTLVRLPFLPGRGWGKVPPESSTSTDSTALLFTDPRRFGGLWSYPSLDHLRQHRWSTLGPDALTITTPDLLSRIADSNRPIKAALLDQTAIAGVGNIYADEALFEARIAPTTLASKIKPEQISVLTDALRLILSRAVAAGGSTLRDYVDATGQPGRAQGGHAVYGRAGKPCLRCQRPLHGSTIAQRTTVWCQTCQPASTTRFSTKRPQGGVR